MQIRRIFCAVLVFAMVFSLSGCRNKEDENPNSTPEIMEEDELVIYHNNTALSEGLMALTEEYSKATGKKVSAKLAGNDFMGEIESSGTALYVVDTKSDLSGMHSGGFFMDLLNSLGLSKVISNIPAGLQLNNTGLGSYGIPLMLEGYGYIFDREMMVSLFGEEQTDNLINDLKTCSFTDFESFVAAVDTYISTPSTAKITVNGNSYTFEKEKTGKSQNLTGVFALNYESAEASKALLSTALASKFASRYEVLNADADAVQKLENVLSAFTEALALHTENIAGAKGSISRGDEFTGGDYNYSTAIDLFTGGYALFYPGGTSDAQDFEKSSAGFGKSLDILPMKLPISDTEVASAGMTAEKLQRSIVIGSRYYLALNPKASETLSSAAEDFISWIYEDESGKTAYSSAFGAIPHNFGYMVNDETADTAPETANDSMQEGANNAAPDTESGTVSPENSTPSGTGENDQAGIENENSGSSADMPSAPENQQDSEMPSPAPSHNISDSLLASVAQYYAAGNWIPDMSIALPGDWAKDVLEEGLSDFFGMETWAESDRKNFIDTLIGGWKDRLEDKKEENVG